jgi:hypothetical protein
MRLAFWFAMNGVTGMVSQFHLHWLDFNKIEYLLLTFSSDRY